METKSSQEEIWVGCEKIGLRDDLVLRWQQCNNYCYLVGFAYSLGKKPPQSVSFKQGLAAPLLASVSLFGFYSLLRFFPNLDIHTFISAYLGVAGVVAVSSNLAPPLRAIIPNDDKLAFRIGMTLLRNLWAVSQFGSLSLTMVTHEGRFLNRLWFWPCSHFSTFSLVVFFPSTKDENIVSLCRARPKMCLLMDVLWNGRFSKVVGCGWGWTCARYSYFGWFCGDPWYITFASYCYTIQLIPHLYWLH